ncbi:chorismate mutase [Hyphobacterium sp. HN65]|uniref:chorismate mutase n=1 Tax=Hyphobacterium lacteum TaxID=3116575 RepID=A0ABU7LQN5_9PROT|nr:chorismate mutase [Hyphobacterium sp. HN65]MEE2526226.1 chorismate mutase [Hyphobacterium sp. HN65]
MSEVRTGVDAIDRELVRLLATRSAYMEAAARIKPDRGAVRDEWRKQDVLSKVRAAAKENGVPLSIVDTTWEALVEASIAYEFTVWDKTRN